MAPVLIRRLLRISTGSLAGIFSLCGLSAIAVQQHVMHQDEAANHFLEQVSQFPKNQSAHALEVHLRSLGLGVPLSQRSEDSLQAKAAAIQSELDAYFRAQRAKEKGGVAVLPATVQDFIQEHEADFVAVEALLLNHPVPAWTVDLGQLTHNPVQPDFFPLARLQRLLLARSIFQQQRLAQQVFEIEGEQPGVLQGEALQREALKEEALKLSDRSLAAAWVLPQSLKTRPDLLSQIFASIMVQQQTGLLRHLDVADTAWQSRLAGDDQMLILDALQFDSWLEYRRLRQLTAARPSSSPWSAIGQWAQNPLDRQYLRLSQTDWVRSRLRSYQQLPETVCETQPEQFKLASSWWNVFGKSGAPQLSKEWAKAGDRRLAAELTQKVLQAKALAAEQGQWPKQLPHLQSQVCPNVAWVYERRADGGIDIALNTPPTWRLDVKHDRLPLKYSAAPYVDGWLGPEPQTTSARKPD